MNNQDPDSQYHNKKVYPPNLPSIPPPPQQPLSGRPATPRMLRSISGTLKSKTELAHSDKGQESNNEIKNSNSPHYVSDTHTRQPPPESLKSNIQAPTAVHGNQQKGSLLPPPSIPNPNTMKPAPTPTGKIYGDWNFVKTIGAGSMGKVKFAQHNATHEICAVKIIPRAAKLYQRAHANDPPPQTTQEAAQRHKEFEKEVARDRRTIREGALGRLLYHPFICRLYEMVPMTNHYYMLFEYIEGGQMLDYIVAHGSLKERHARKFARGIASALDYCHRNNVVHRDLKIENIMINEKGDIKIIDFGLSNLYAPKNLLKTYCGSLYFAAPELLSAKPYIGPEVDVWSFGVVLYVLVCGKVPFDDQSVSVLHEKIKKGNVEYPAFLSRECVSLLSRMLVVDPTKRASLYEVCSHPWMNKGYDYKVNNYLPRREPLRLPLDPEIIKTIANFELGTVQGVADELTSILTSVEYQMSCENWYKITETGREYASSQNAQILPDPTGGFHPLVSIYYLVDEMRKRKKAKEEALKAQRRAQVPTIAVPTPKQQQQQQPQPAQPQPQPQPEVSQPFGNTAQANTTAPKIVETFSETPQRTLDPSKQSVDDKPSAPGPSIAVPEQAHTTSVPSSFVKTQTSIDEDQLSIPKQQSPRTSTPQTLDPAKVVGGSSGSAISAPNAGSGAGFNSLLSPQPTKADPMVRRGVSMKVTAKEKQTNTRPPKSELIKKKPQHGRSSSTSNKMQGFIPVEYLPPLPTIDTNTNTIVSDGAKQQNLTVPSTARHMHPTARAKSVGGGHMRKDSYGRVSHGSQNPLPPLPTSMASQNSQEVVGKDTSEGFFDDVQLDDVGYQEVPQLTESEIIEQYNISKPNSMPSIEHCKTLFLKGFFSVQTTSAKPLPVIRYNIINVLSKLGVKFQEVKGGFVCMHTPSVQPSHSNELDEENKLYGDAFKSKSSDSFEAAEPEGSKTPSRQPSLQLPIGGNVPRRKFSIGNAFNTYRKKNGSQVMMPPNTPATAKVIHGLYDDDDKERNGEDDDDEDDYGYDDSADSLNGYGGGSDMLISSRIEQRAKHQRTVSSSSQKASKSPLKFEIHIVKVPLVGLYGVQFKKILGNTWNYKTLASQILNEMNL
ncbi:Protein kinase domain family protein [Candida albicans]|uniref:non-specific serine/threonine protein kinase n=1 Tax=Candida albicans TaxID=5476 RepID=A0A8H6C3A0_CANAX|nr:Protein kinase domain family protein [Candida albicans]